jgi:hypothetical protein
MKVYFNKNYNAIHKLSEVLVKLTLELRNYEGHLKINGNCFITLKILLYKAYTLQPPIISCLRDNSLLVYSAV